MPHVTRRDTLRGLGGAALLLATPRLALADADNAAKALNVACQQRGRDQFELVALDGAGAPLWSTPLPGRGHGVALRPQGDLIALTARRPGSWLWVVDVHSGQTRHQIEAPSGRHFYGHGCFNADGTRYFATENEIQSGQGYVAIYAADAGFKRLGAFPVGGIGPHEILLDAPRQELVVAIGGILTHPDRGRDKLNLDSMRPALARFSLDGVARSRVEPPARWSQLSIRHIALAPNGTTVMAMQYQGPKDQEPPLWGVADAEGMRLYHGPAGIARRLRHYMGSAVVDGSGAYAAITAPRANTATFWRLADGALVGELAMADVCGAAALEGAGRFVLTGGGGWAVETDVTGRVSRRWRPHGNGAWDNHLA
ncbi:DUF1513 domain-containing protein [Magnetofaba australis]|uniref:Putative twin-arginine translocation pathway signal n=1 Tax=Magnetofaba australis IT-1 TaxID=1434232 RepID=A0A1Y2K9G5_9PROT|nr:DUF1513 domain-containing protein [Magnetofaba australis]OSM07137.1 putative twin-arginine translocation pathway signal [Magnetofaba australis IT-1]